MREGGSISCESCHFRTARASGSLANCDSALTCLQLQNKPLVSAAGKVNGFRIQPLLLQKIPFVSKTYRRSRRSENGYPKLRSEPVEPSVRPNPLWQRDSSSTCFFFFLLAVAQSTRTVGVALLQFVKKGLDGLKTYTNINQHQAVHHCVYQITKGSLGPWVQVTLVPVGLPPIPDFSLSSNYSFSFWGEPLVTRAHVSILVKSKPKKEHTSPK